MCKRIDRWDRWDTRLPSTKDQEKVTVLFHKSGAKTKSDFVRDRLLDKSFKIITEDKSTVEYYRKLSNITALIQKIGILYNQTVKAINSYQSINQDGTDHTSKIRAIPSANDHPRATGYWANLRLSEVINAKRPCMIKFLYDQGRLATEPKPPRHCRDPWKEDFSDSLSETIEAGYKCMKQEILSLVACEMEWIKSDTKLKHLIKE